MMAKAATRARSLFVLAVAKHSATSSTTDTTKWPQRRAKSSTTAPDTIPAMTPDDQEIAIRADQNPQQHDDGGQHQKGTEHVGVLEGRARASVRSGKCRSLELAWNHASIPIRPTPQRPRCSRPAARSRRLRVVGERQREEHGGHRHEAGDDGPFGGAVEVATDTTPITKPMTAIVSSTSSSTMRKRDAQRWRRTQQRQRIMNS